MRKGKGSEHRWFRCVGGLLAGGHRFFTGGVCACGRTFAPLGLLFLGDLLWICFSPLTAISSGSPVAGVLDSLSFVEYALPHVWALAVEARCGLTILNAYVEIVVLGSPLVVTGPSQTPPMFCYRSHVVYHPTDLYEGAAGCSCPRSIGGRSFVMMQWACVKRLRACYIGSACMMNVSSLINK